jgi:uncharacterized peroxidase-related enzyme
MSWIKILSYEESTGSLRKLYNRVKDSDNYIDNILLVHGLRPPTLKGHLALYKNVLHHRDNTIPKWMLEALGVYVSHLNGCEYCVFHHFAGLKTLVNDPDKSKKIGMAILSNQPEDYFEGRELAMLEYAEKLTVAPGDMEEADIEELREHGLDDGQILEINQVISYFSYANRTVVGLGVNTEGDILGLSPNDDDSEENWTHQ